MRPRYYPPIFSNREWTRRKTRINREWTRMDANRGDKNDGWEQVTANREWTRRKMRINREWTRMDANRGDKNDGWEQSPSVHHYGTPVPTSPLFAFIRVHSRLIFVFHSHPFAVRKNLCNLRIIHFRGFRLLDLLGLLVVAPWLCVISADAQVLPAPFGLQWGETSSRILSFAERAGSGIQIRSGSAERETIEVRGPFSNQRYQRLGFTFQADRLVQVAVYYPALEDSNQARELLATLRRELEQSFGPGQLLETGSEKNADGHLETRRVFRWEREGCAIWLISMQVGNTTEDTSPLGEISVVYANLGLGRQLEIESQASGDR
jgi:hypothetical protein